MTRKPILRIVLLIFTLLLGSVAVQAALAQGGNLLTNPGFEQPFEAVPNHAPSMVAQGWTPWFSNTEPNTTPEYYPASDTANGMATPRIHSGSDAQQYFTFFAAHDAGVYQHVAGLNPGDELTFSVYAYIWASSGDDANVSDGNGNLAVQVGIDPNGGTDASSSDIVWSNPLAFVDQYVQHSVSATSFGDAVTVFVRSSVTKVAMNNVVYLDDAELVVTGTGGTVPEVIAATAEMTAEATMEAPTEVMAETEAPVMTEAPTEVMAETEAAAMTEAPTEVIAPTEMPAMTEAPTEVIAPTEAPTEAIPTEVPPTEIPTEAPPTEIPATPAPTNTPMPTATLDTSLFPYSVEYTVVRGDTVGNLATRFGSTVEAIIIANGLSADARIYETQKIAIPVPVLPSPTLPVTATLPPMPTATLIPAMPTEAPVVVQPAASETPVIVQPASGESAAPNASTTYVVRFGDTLSSIASRFAISTRELARANNIVNPNVIYVGQILRIPSSPYPTPYPTPTRGATTIPTAVPPSHLYQVMPGDNLYRISVRFNVSLADLIQINGIMDASHIFVGQVLIIP